MLGQLKRLRERVLAAIAHNAEIAGRVASLSTPAPDAPRPTLDVQASDDHTIWHYWNGQRWEPRVVARHKE